MWIGGLLLVLVMYWIVMLMIAMVHFIIVHWWVAVLAVLACVPLYLVVATWQRRTYRNSRLRLTAEDHARDRQRLRQAYQQAHRDIDHILKDWR